MNFYPPFLGAGIRVSRIGPDRRGFRARLGLHWYNRNYVGTHFGGSLYTMCDPFFMLILLEELGPGYVVWDKAASIRFLKPGRGTLTAEFHIPEERLVEIRRLADTEGKTEPLFSASVRDEGGEEVARVEKVLYVRKREAGAG